MQFVWRGGVHPWVRQNLFEMQLVLMRCVQLMCVQLTTLQVCVCVRTRGVCFNKNHFLCQSVSLLRAEDWHSARSGSRLREDGLREGGGKEGGFTLQICQCLEKLCLSLSLVQEVKIH